MSNNLYKLAAICITGMVLAGTVSAQTIQTIAGSGTNGYLDAGTATSAQFAWPNQVALDASGNMYITDRGNNKIRKVSTTGAVTTIAGTIAGFGGDGGPAASGMTMLSSPCGILVDPAGNILFADLNNARVRKINTSGVISTIAGGGTGLTDGIMATAAAIGNPVGIALDAAGNLYIATYSDNKVRKVSTTGTITTVAGTGTAGFSGDGGAATAATLNNPHGVALDAAGNLYITDIANHRIRKVNTSGTISTIAGTGTGAYSGDGGAATAAQLWSPYGILVDAANNVFFTDYVNNRVRRIDASGTITTVAGAGGYSYSGDGGAATAATMANPIGLAIDNANNIIVVDGDNERVRRINAATATITGSGNICVGATATYTSSLSGGTWTSTGTGTATVSSTGVVTGVAGGTAVISYSGTLVSGAQVVTVNPLPAAPSITASGSTLSVPAIFATYQWSLGGTPIAGATSATHNATTSGTYAVAVTDAGGCGATSAGYVYTTVSVASLKAEGAMQLFPNPVVNGTFTVTVPAVGNETIGLVVVNAIGEEVMTTSAPANEPLTLTLNVPAGVYMVRATTSNANYYARVVMN